MSGTGLGIVAGGGELPLEVARATARAGRPFFVVALKGLANPWVQDFPHAWLSLGQVGAAIDTLKRNRCRDIVLAGYVARPNFLKLRYDAKGLSLLPRVIWAMRKGDNTLLDALVAVLEREGLSVKSVADVAPALQIPIGPLGRIKPAARDLIDIDLALSHARKQGVNDVGQAVIVRDGDLIAVEGNEGTDAMLAKLRSLVPPETGSVRCGVLAKALKPMQDGRTDLPTIGVATVVNAAAAGLAGIAIEAHTALVLDLPSVIAEADRRGVFIVGVEA
jgi:DUF1009 family protein